VLQGTFLEAAMLLFNLLDDLAHSLGDLFTYSPKKDINSGGQEARYEVLFGSNGLPYFQKM
jgi:hypothetical protein